jgi:hypothetical protein
MRLDDAITLALVAILLASVWHPFGRGRSKARAAWYRLAVMLGFLAAQVLVEASMGSTPVGNGPAGATCPNIGTPWYVAGILLAIALWSGVGVLKGFVASLYRREEREGETIAASMVAVIAGFVGIVVWVAVALCDYS